MDAATSAIMMNSVEELFQTLSENLSDLLALESKLSKEEYASSGRTFAIVLVVSAIVFLAAVGLSLVISLIMKSLYPGPGEEDSGSYRSSRRRGPHEEDQRRQQG